MNCGKGSLVVAGDTGNGKKGVNNGIRWFRGGGPSRNELVANGQWIVEPQSHSSRPQLFKTTMGTSTK